MEVPVGPLIDDVVQIARDTLPKDIAISSAVEDGLPPLVGDPTQFHQVLLNLCVNARDAMPGGGRLHVSASAMSLPSLGEPLLRDAAAGPYVVIEVEDTGIGIPAGEIDRIFDPFFTTKAPGKGTGLGLSTSLTIVRNHGGQIRVYSEPGRGTRFRVYLPTPGAAPAAALRRDAAADRGRRRRDRALRGRRAGNPPRGEAGPRRRRVPRARGHQRRRGGGHRDGGSCRHRCGRDRHDDAGARRRRAHPRAQAAGAERADHCRKRHQQQRSAGP